MVAQIGAKLHRVGKQAQAFRIDLGAVWRPGGPRDAQFAGNRTGFREIRPRRRGRHVGIAGTGSARGVQESGGIPYGEAHGVFGRNAA